MVEKCEYFAPLASPKPKYARLSNKLDLLKINNGKYGVINFNNMIPVTNNNYEEFDLNKKTDDKSEMFRINLLNNQLRWLTSNKQEVFKKSRLLYNLYKNNKLPNNVKDRCCNFPLLEEKCNEYNK
jgi:protein AbiQ